MWDTDAAFFGLRDYGDDRKDVVINTEQTGDNIRLQAAGEDRVFVSGKGRVGIATTTPSEVLEVNGTVLATSVEQTSARRFKTDVHPLTGASELVEALDGVRFTRVDSGQPGVGFIAEEVQTVLPSLVSEGADGRVKGLQYAQLTAVLVEAWKEQNRVVQEQKQRIQTQKKRIDDQQEQIDQLRQRLADLEASVGEQ